MEIKPMTYSKEKLFGTAVEIPALPDAANKHILPRHLQRIYSAAEIGVMQELEKHNLTRITNAPADFLIQF